MSSNELVYPLSSSQQRLMLLTMLRDEAELQYTLTLALRLRGSLDHSALERALQALLDRHDGLRARLDFVGSIPVQVISEQQTLAWSEVDLSGLEPGEARREARRLATDEANSTLPLMEGPLFRALLLRQGPAEHLLVLTCHHLNGDLVSLWVLADDLRRLYAAYVDGREPELEPASFQTGDYALWDWERLRSPELAARRSWWSEYLVPLPPPLEFERRHDSLLGAAAAARLSLGEEIEDALAALEPEVTPYQAFLAAYVCLLHDLRPDYEEMLIGGTVSMRLRPELQRVVSLCVNSVALRIRPDWDGSFRELLMHVREQARLVAAYGDVPFPWVSQDVGSGDGRPLYGAFFSLHEERPLATDWPGLVVSQVKLPERVVPFPGLSLWAERHERGFELLAHARATCFDDAELAALLERFESLCAQGFSAPDIALRELVR